MKHTNELIHETSPYLLQHAHNPVNWHPWGEKAFEKAKKENKMLIISIGYAACHWCHVMEHESFENEDVATVMNEHFVSIKVDREERPDVDMIYMSAAQLINGNGGWPLNALAFPDGKPFFAATYFPREKWIQLLQYFIKESKENPKLLVDQAEHLSKGIRDIDHIPFGDEAPDFSKQDIELIKDHLFQRIDLQNGGLSSTVKFPMPSVWEWLLEYYHLSGNKDALDYVKLTLDKMKDGGIYDQVGGGFARYSTDPLWHVPHFEKMLYDNAQLISLYSHAYQVTKNDEYERIVRETVEFIKRELYDGNGFYASLDADSEKEEGKFYVWTFSEIDDILGSDADTFCRYFGITRQGNWENGKNIPDRNFNTQNPDTTAGFDKKTISTLKSRLLKERNKRVRPALDDKILTSWNAMMSIGLVQAWRAFQIEEYYNLARKNIQFLLSKLWDEKDKILYRNYQKGKAATPAFLDDYAFLVNALIEFYQVSFDIKVLHKAQILMDTVLENFSDSSNKMFFYNDSRFDQLITRPTETNDNVIPSSNSVMAENLYLLGLLTGDDKMIQHAATMVKNMKSEILSNSVYQTNWGKLLLQMAHPPFEIAIMGKDWKSRLLEMQQNFLPGCTFCGGEEENLPLLLHKNQPGKTMIYVCENKSCKSPVESVDQALKFTRK